MKNDILLHPDILKKSILGKQMADRLVQAARATKTESINDKQQPISIIIRTRNDAVNLETLLRNDLRAQDYSGPIEVVVVDTESTDGTQQVAQKYNAKLVSISQKDFNYPLGLNLAFEACSNDSVFLTVGHANLSNNKTLKAVNHWLSLPDVGGVYGVTLPGLNASKTERLFFGTVFRHMNPAAAITEIYAGTLAANCAAISKNVWHELGGFDERFAGGGEDTELARRMFEAGYSVIFDPVLSVHHSHGLGPINIWRQSAHWKSVFSKPEVFDAAKLNRRRPDLKP